MRAIADRQFTDPSELEAGFLTGCACALTQKLACMMPVLAEAFFLECVDKVLVQNRTDFSRKCLLLLATGEGGYYRAPKSGA